MVRGRSLLGAGMPADPIIPMPPSRYPVGRGDLGQFINDTRPGEEVKVCAKAMSLGLVSVFVENGVMSAEQLDWAIERMQVAVDTLHKMRAQALLEQHQERNNG